MRGKFIVFEGADHCGKGTQVELLKNALQNTNELDNWVFTREPGGTRISEQIRQIILDPANQMNPITEAYLYAASRAEHVAHMKEILESGRNVICERYYFSSIVYQGIVRGLGPGRILKLNETAIDGLIPDTVFYFKISLDTYKERRMKQKELDRLEQESIDFFEKILNAYDLVFDRQSEYNLIKIDGAKPIQEVHEDIMIQINKLKEDMHV